MPHDRFTMYNWQLSDWPQFRYDLTDLEGTLLAFADKSGQVKGLLKGLPEGVQTETIVDIMIAEAIKTSEIEGEYLSRSDVKSSIRNRLGLNASLETVKDAASAGIAELMVAVRDTWQEPLHEETLFSWHRMLMKGEASITAGKWRNHEEPMQVVSGAIGRQKIHFEAPPSPDVPTHMNRFIHWFNASESTIKHAPLRSALAHLYFESIHPFEDGNGRMGRAISEKAISQGLQRPALLSISRTIEANKNDYYAALEASQKSNEVTQWIRYFINMVLEAQIDTEQQINFILQKTKFFDLHKNNLNERQMRIVRRMLEEGSDGFEGGMNTRKYISIAKTSRATATRDLQELVKRGVFVALGGGHSTRYELNLNFGLTDPAAAGSGYT
jgi:Fic family protein